VSFEIAKYYAASDIVPAHFRKPENAFIALQMAERMNIDPFMLMQNMYVIHGKPGIEAKLLIALINQSGKLDGPLEYRFSGEGDSLTCRCVAFSSGREIEGPPVSIAMAKSEGWSSKSGSKWKTMPELMLRYRAAAFFARTVCPELTMGMHIRDEIEDIEAEIVQPVEQKKYQLPGIEKKNEYEIQVCSRNDCKKYAPEFVGRCGMEEFCEKFQQARIMDLLKSFSNEQVRAAKLQLGVEKAETPEQKWQLYVKLVEISNIAG